MQQIAESAPFLVRLRNGTLAGSAAALVTIGLVAVTLMWWYRGQLSYFGVGDLLYVVKYALPVFVAVAVVLTLTPTAGLLVLSVLALFVWVFAVNTATMNISWHGLEGAARVLPDPFVIWSLLCLGILAVAARYLRSSRSTMITVRAAAVGWLVSYGLALYVQGRYPWYHIDPYPAWNSTVGQLLTLSILLGWPILALSFIAVAGWRSIRNSDRARAA